MRLLVAALLLAACTAAEAPAQQEARAPAAATNAAPMPAAPPSLAPTTLTLHCAGAFTQGGIGLCRTLPGAAIFVDGVASGEADAQGWAVVGFTREHGADGRIEARSGGESVAQNVSVAARQFDIQRVNGLPQQTVTPTDPAIIARIQREAEVKNAAFQSIAPLEGWLDGFVRPIDMNIGVVTGTWGNQRILNGTPSSPHFGYDIAAPIGTPVHAPASGVVALAETDTFYEGGLVFIDHGEGLITMYLHMSRVDVHVGDHVAQGQVIGAVGDRGRATGPHLCWRMKWRERQLDPSLALTALNEARTQLAGAH
jgi:murein DD-endopeptidase MepM/ murein hydrolase activator NlpD